MIDRHSSRRGLGAIFLYLTLGLLVPANADAQFRDAYRIKDINAGSSSSMLTLADAAELGGELFFPALAADTGRELWKTDGTEAGTVLVLDINAGTGSSSPENLVVVGNEIFFTATDGVFGVELWKTDGTAAGTEMITDLETGAGSSSPASLTNVNGTVFFSATTLATGLELFKTDGTEAGTVLVHEFETGPLDADRLREFAALGNELFFTVVTAVGDEPWMSDGTSPGTRLLKDIWPGSSGGGAGEKAVFNGELYFQADDGSNGLEMWKTDGTTAGTVLVKDIRTAAGADSEPRAFTELNGLLYFSATDGINGRELWRTDGTELGTEMVVDLWPGSGGSFIFVMARFNNELYFSARVTTNNPELFKTDGSAAGTVLVKEIDPDTGLSGGSNPSNFIVSEGELFFSADDGTHGRELWRTDGTTSGTVLLADLNVGSNSSQPSTPHALGSRAIYSANVAGTPGGGIEPYAISFCNDGEVDPPEQCDEGVANGSATTCCDNVCGFVSPGAECRADLGVCDTAEQCTGSAGACPADAVESAGVECRAAGDVCDVAETCDGVASTCPADGFVAGGTECRASAGVCDAAEACTGSAPACPGDALESAGTECRAAADLCDAAESCDGVAADCPADGFVAAGIECRASVDLCDAAESCDGAAAACPSDEVVAAGVPCRAAAGVCDLSEACDGAANACPVDVKSMSVCRPALDPQCDSEEFCDGAANDCPADQHQPNGTACEDGDVCSAADTCDSGQCVGAGFVDITQVRLKAKLRPGATDDRLTVKTRFPLAELTDLPNEGGMEIIVVDANMNAVYSSRIPAENFEDKGGNGTNFRFRDKSAAVVEANGAVIAKVRLITKKGIVKTTLKMRDREVPGALGETLLTVTQLFGDPGSGSCLTGLDVPCKAKPTTTSCKR